MAFDSSPSTEAWHVLVSVALTGGTVRYAETDLAMDDGTAYEGRVLSIPALRLSTGTILDPRLVSPSLDIVLADADKVVRDSFDSEEWRNKAVTIQAGQGLTIADYETVFEGVVRFGSRSWDTTTARFGVDDVRARDAVALPATLYDPATYTNMEEKSEYKPIPLVYGSWLTADGGGETLPAVCIDTTAGTGGQFKVAAHALKTIEAVYLNGAAITGNCTLDAANGQFTISSTSTYDPDVDTVTVNCSGATDDGTTSGALLQSLPDILDDLLQTHMGVAAGDIDSAAMAAWEAELDASDYGRRWIGETISSDDLIRDLLVEGFADITISAGDYTPAYRIVEAASGASTFTSANIRERSGGVKDFSVQADPEGIFANEVIGDYRYAPASAVFRGSYTSTDAASVALLGTTKRRRLTMRWLYTTAGARRRINRERYLFSREPESATMTLDPAALTKGPTDQFRLVHDKYDSTPWQIRSIVLDLLGKQAVAQCWNMLRLTPGRWVASTAPAWSAATAAEKAESGFWTDSSGRADSGDANSTGSIWF